MKQRFWQQWEKGGGQVNNFLKLDLIMLPDEVTGVEKMSGGNYNWPRFLIRSWYKTVLMQMFRDRRLINSKPANKH